jgi:hypothetical protein
MYRNFPVAKQLRNPCASSGKINHIPLHHRTDDNRAGKPISRYTYSVRFNPFTVFCPKATARVQHGIPVVHYLKIVNFVSRDNLLLNKKFSAFSIAQTASVLKEFTG